MDYYKRIRKGAYVDIHHPPSPAEVYFGISRGQSPSLLPGGHRYSPVRFLAAHADTRARIFWAAVVALEEGAEIAHELAAHSTVEVQRLSEEETINKYERGEERSRSNTPPPTTAVTLVNGVIEQRLIKGRPDLESHSSTARALERQVVFQNRYQSESIHFGVLGGLRSVR
jgi:hypothetical protein